MARKLPWKKTECETPRSILQRTPKTEYSPHVAHATPSRSGPVAAAAQPRVNLHDASRIRSPSTSPPPEPPQEHFMIPDDDRYRLVEDELLHTARKFTTHLHRAEYERLKRLARSQNAGAIREIERPVVAGLHTTAAKRRREAVARDSKQRRVLQSAADGQADSLPWEGTSLQGLMETPRAETSSIAAVPGLATGTRAAAGHQSRSNNPDGISPGSGSGPRQGNSTSSSSLSSSRVLTSRIPVTPRPRVYFSHSESPGTYTSRDAEMDTPWQSLTVGSARDRRPGRRERDNRQEEEGEVIVIDDDDDDPFGVNRRKVRREKSREHLRKSGGDAPKKLPPDTIPLFL